MSDFHRGTRRFDDVEAASFSPDDTDLTVTEDGGDWVAKDDVGNVVLRYDEAVGDWVMDSLKTDVLSIAETKAMESGTVIQTGAIPAFGREISTTSQRSNEPTYLNIRYPAGDLAVGDLTRVFLLACQVDPGTDETARINLKNTTDGDTITEVEISNITTAGNYVSDNGWAAYTPGTTNEPITLLPQVTTQPGTNSTTFRGLTIYTGVRVP